MDPMTPEEELAALRARILDLETEVQGLRQSTRTIQSLISETPLVIYAKDPNYRFVLTNQRHASLIGLSEKDILYHTDRELFGESADPIDAVSDRVITTGHPESSEFTLMLEGEARTFLETIFRLHDDNDKILGLGGIATDITQRRALETELRIFKILSDQSPWGVAIVGIEGDEHEFPRYVNHAFWSLFTEDVSRLHNPNGWVQCIAMDVRRSLGDAAVWQGELQLIRESGAPFPAAVSAFRLSDHHTGMDALVLGIRDITEEKLHEQERERITGLIAARDAAEATSKTKTEFLAQMSHEIRTPMAAIIGYIDLIQHGNPDPNEVMHHVASVRRNAEHLVAILDDILDISRIEADKMSFILSAFDPRKLISDVELLLIPLATERGLTLKKTLPPLLPRAITSDPLRLQQCIINLVNNAIKFTDQGFVEVRLCLEKPHQLRIDVIDTGIGMSEEQVSSLFTPFSQPHERRNVRGRSTGLGLAISSRLIQGLGGQLLVSSELGQGSTFTLILPLKPEECKDLVPDLSYPTLHSVVKVEPLSTKQAMARVLLVEDSSDLRLLVERHLLKLGLDVTMACNGQEGVDRVIEAEQQGHPFDIILLDMQMPVMDGYTAIQEMRRLGCQAYVVATTAFAMPEDIEHCIHLGCSAHLAKPFNFKQLRSVIETMPKGNASLH